MAKPACISVSFVGFAAIFFTLANPTVGQTPTQCDVPGECIGNLLGATFVSTSADCLLACKETEGCLWYTANPPLEFCGLYSTCGLINEAQCPECLSGESSCPLCDLPGLCQGVLLNQGAASSQEECQTACSNNAACNAYTYKPDEAICLQFASCSSVDQQACPSCVTSEPDCGVPVAPENEFIMVIGGWEKYATYDTVEIVSPNPSVPVPTCAQSMNPFPKEISWGAGGVMQLDEIPTVCGGMGPNGEIYSDCYMYDMTIDSWSKSGDLSTGRSSPGVAYNLVFGLVMAGGFASNYLDSVEYTRNGIDTDFIAPMPEAHAGSCLVILDYNTLFLAGGYGGALGYTNKTYILNRGDNIWNMMADMPTARSVLSCGIVNANSGTGMEIVAAGGTDIGTARDYVEIYNIEGDVWRIATPLPQTLLGAATVKYQDTFILVGGRNSSMVTLDTLYMYQAANESWIELDAKLLSGKKDVVAMVVKESNLPPCPPEQPEFIMAIGGWEKYQYYSTVEIVSPNASIPVPTCMQNLNSFPKNISWGAGGVMQLDEIPTVCGGMGPNGEVYADCLKYDAMNDSWSKSGDLSTGRSSPGVAYNLVFGLVMAGGWNRTEYLETVEYTRNGIATDFIANLPEAHAGNCLVMVDFNTLFLAGGYGGSAFGYTNKTFILDRITNLWSRMADMPTGRSVLSCGIVNANSGTGREIVAAGGTDIGSARDYVEIYNIDGNVWRTANPLPQTLLGAATVQYQDTFLLVGGRNSSLVTVDTLYMYQASDESWIELDAKLQSGRKDVIAMVVKESNFPQCT